jgi:membrane-bound ClpP family serine protease
LQNWDKWSRFRLWRRTRPLAGSILMFLSSLLLLALGIYFLPFAFLTNTVWISLFLGGLLLIMALVQLFLPTYAVLTGSIGILVSLVSFFTSSFGGLFIGMVLGIIGGALSLAWRPVKRSRLAANRSSSTHA